MKKLVILLLFLLPAPLAVAMHNRFRTDVNGNYLPLYGDVVIFNKAYPEGYGIDPLMEEYAARYCSRMSIGHSMFGIRDKGRCTLRYGRYGKYGLARGDEEFLTTSAAYISPLRRMPDAGIASRRGTSRLYPEVPEPQYGIAARSGQSRYYADLQ